jgi:hypothetical protein
MALVVLLVLVAVVVQALLSVLLELSEAQVRLVLAVAVQV